MRLRRVGLVSVLLLGSGAALMPVLAQARPARACGGAGEAVTLVKIADRPADAVATRDGCWIFVSALRDAGGNGIAVLRRDGGGVEQVGFAVLEGAPFGLVLTHDEKLLIVAAGTHVALLHVGRLLSGQGQPLVGMIRDSTFVGSIMVNVTADDRYVFVSQERTASIAVIDLANLKSAGSGAPAIVGSIPTGNAPISIELARDERYLYATSQTAPAAWGWPVLCPPQGNPKGAPDHRQGVVLVIDVARAKQNPRSAHRESATAQRRCWGRSRPERSRGSCI
jgi:DNA-binding beta-propeller fold protein YncE